MIFQLSSSRLGFHYLFHGHPTTVSHSFQRFFPYFTRSLSVSRSGLLVWPTKITSTVQKIGLINKPRPFSSSISKSIALAGLGLGLATWNKSAIRCEGMCPMTSFSIIPKFQQPAPEGQPNVNSRPVYPPAPPVSSVSFYELGFGTVAGVCTGVFIKKGAKALAFLLGGVFVLLQVQCFTITRAL